MQQQAIRIDTLTEADWPAVARIHQEGIDAGMATFETEPPRTWSAWQQGKIAGCSLAARARSEVIGWAALSRVSSRRCYGGVAEVSIYVGGAARGRGVGSLLLSALIARADACGLWTLQATIFPENEGSLRLHTKHGFRVVGRRERIARMEVGPAKGVWRDRLLLERRSRVVGV